MARSDDEDLGAKPLGDIILADPSVLGVGGGESAWGSEKNYIVKPNRYTNPGNVKQKHELSLTLESEGE